MITSRPQPDCYLCASPGQPLYAGLTDRRYGVEGAWGMRVCPAEPCGLIWLDPMPLESAIGKAYETYHTHSASQGSALRRLHGAVGEAFVRRRFGYPGGNPFLALLAFLNPGGLGEFGRTIMYLPAPTAGAKLLDVGCGNGALLLRMRELGWDVEGIDPDPAAVEIARSHGLAVHPGDLASAGFAAESFDAICMSHVIEHVHDPIALLRECRRILKPGGALTAITPNTESMGHRLSRRLWYALDPPRHLMLFRAPNLRRIAEMAGLTVTQLDSGAAGAREIWRKGQPHRRGTGLSFQLRERLAIALGRQVGEELVLKARVG